jgi:hypothetical protein
MSGNWTLGIGFDSFSGNENVTPWSLDREK